MNFVSNPSISRTLFMLLFLVLSILFLADAVSAGVPHHLSQRYAPLGAPHRRSSRLATQRDLGSSDLTDRSVPARAWSRRARRRSGSRAELVERDGAAPACNSTKGSVLKTTPGGYTLQDDYSGPGFFDMFNFFNAADPTHGLVDYVSADQAQADQLAYVRDDGVIFMRVDNSTTLEEGQPRKSVRIESKKTYGTGSLVILDVYAMPHGCSVWPAFWMTSQTKQWPDGGEIDIIEGVNEDPGNHMTLHTLPGCTLDTAPGRKAFTAKVASTNCDALANNNAGCSFQDTHVESYGHGFNMQAGGVFATQIADSGVQIWRFNRSSIPDDIESGNPDPSSWGVPAASWSSSTCPIGQFIDNSQMLIFDITLCGDWAGSVYGGNGCGGTCQSAVANPSNFDLAHFIVKSLKVYNSS